MARQSALALGVVLIASMAASCTCGTRKQHAVSRNSKGTALGKKAQHKRVRRVVVTRQQQHWLWRRVWRQTQNLREQIRTGYGVTPKRTIAHVLRDASVAGQSREYRDLLDDLRRNLVALQETPEVVRLYNNVIDVCAKCHSKFSKKELARVNALRLEDKDVLPWPQRQARMKIREKFRRDYQARRKRAAAKRAAQSNKK